MAENPPEVLSRTLKIAASSNPLLLFDPDHESGLYSVKENLGRERLGQLTTGKV